jgi:acetyl esterase
LTLLDPEILAARKRQAAAFPAIDPSKLPPAEARRLMNEAAMFFSDGGPALAGTEEVTVSGPVGTIRGRIYRPSLAAYGGAILFLHGGGWFNCNIDTHDRVCRCLALGSGQAVLAIDYRLAPEHPFPAGLEDCLAAWRWLADEAPALGVDPARIAVAGDSAGASLALALAMSERDAGRPLPSRIALAYGCFAPVFDTESHRAFGDGRVGLTTERMRWYWQNYLGPELDHPPAPATPSHGDLRGLPPIYVTFAEQDVLADDSRFLAQRLRDAGVENLLEGWPGAPHGFMQLTRDSAVARAAVAKMAEFLKGGS